MKNNTTSNKLETADAIRAVSELLEGIRKDKMTFVQPLSAAEREATPRLGPKTVVLVARCLEAARTHAEALPPVFATLEFEQRAETLLALDGCRTQLEAMLQDVRDTQLKLAGILVPEARSVLDYVQVLSRHPRQPGSTVHRLRARGHPRQGATAPEDSGAAKANATAPAPATVPATPSNVAAVTPLPPVPPPATPATPTQAPAPTTTSASNPTSAAA